MTAWEVSGKVTGNSVPDLDRMSPASLGMAYTALPIKPMLSKGRVFSPEQRFECVLYARYCTRC